MEIQPGFFSGGFVGRHFLLFLLMLSLLPQVLHGQDIDPELQTDPNFKAPVIVDGYELFAVRGVSSYPASLRAKSISLRIQKAAANPQFSIDSLRRVTEPERSQIFAGRQLIMNIYPEDAEIEAISIEVHTELIYAKIGESILRYRLERAPAIFKNNILKVLTAIAILVVSLIVFVWVFRKLNDWVKRKIKIKFEKLENVSFKLIQSEQLLGVLQFFYHLVRLIIIGFIILFFTDYNLGLFPQTRQASTYIFDLLVNPIEKIGLGLVKALPNLVFLVIIFFITKYTLRLIRLFFKGIHRGEIMIKNFDPEWAMPTFKIIKLFVVVFALVIAYPYIPGSGSSAFQGISVFLGILFSLGSSSFIANIIAGYSMTYRRAFKTGDRIKVNEFMGFVQEQSLMVTRMRSVKNEEVVIPNSALLSSSIVNYTQAAKERGIILHTTVGIGYETSWRLVEAMLMEAAKRTAGLLPDPPPYILQQALGDFAVTYEINAYCNDPQRMYFIYTDLHRNILDVFNENNVQIMTPAYEGDPELPKVVPKEQWETPLTTKTEQNPATLNQPPQ